MQAMEDKEVGLMHEEPGTLDAASDEEEEV
jgi:hypothetical protein